MADDSIKNIVAEMSGKETSRLVLERAKAETAARKERADEQVEAARLVAKETLDERDRRWRAYSVAHLGQMTPQQYRDYCQQEYGFDPGV
jgi:hypothetical protein